MCIKVDQDNALRAANRPRADAPPRELGDPLTPAQMHEKLLLTQRLEDVARASGDWIWETDTCHRYTWVHGASLDVTPPAIGELIPAGRVVNWLGEPELPPRDFHAVLSQGEPIVRLVTEERHGDAVRYVSRSAIPLLDDHGVLRGYRGSARDVTQSLEAKMQLWRHERTLRQAKEEAEARSQAKSALVSKVGHELRTPLNAIVGLAQLLQLRDAPADPASVERWIAQIAKTGWHMVDVLDMLMELGRAGAVNASIACRPVDVVETVRDALQIVEPDAHARGVDIVFDEQCVGQVLGDCRAIRQVVVNLLSNAIKYNRSGGWIRLSIGTGGHTGDCIGGCLGDCTRIAVQDTGPGLSREQIGQLYRPFERLGAERSGVQGHGLGLLICKELVASMNGRLEVQSTPGQGSTFSVLLPRADHQQAMRQPSCQAEAFGQASAWPRCGRALFNPAASVSPAQ